MYTLMFSMNVNHELENTPFINSQEQAKDFVLAMKALNVVCPSLEKKRQGVVVFLQ